MLRCLNILLKNIPVISPLASVDCAEFCELVSLINYIYQGLTLDEGASSEDDLLPASPSDGEEEEEGVYAFRRKKDCEYLAVSYT